MENKHQQSIPQEVIDTITKSLQDAVSKLQPYFITLTAEERMRIPKMGEKTLSFVKKSAELIALNPKLTPQYFDMDAFQADLADAFRMRSLLNLSQQLTRALEDIEMCAGSEAFIQALANYNAVKMAAKNGMPGAEVVYDELKKRFPHTGRRKTNDA